MKLNKKGISLIVLVITIIVMIVLAAAIILSLSSSGVIGRANEAKTASDIANKKQAATVALAEYDLAMRAGEIPTDTSATKYVKDRLEAQGIDPSNVAVDEDGKILVGSGGSAIQKGVKVGDYVGYTIPTAVTSTKYKTYDDFNLEESDTYFATEINMKWKYMGVDENGNALLVSENPTIEELYIHGAEGYLRGISKLDDLCKELYSTSLGKARSIDAQDVNTVLRANPVGQFYNSQEVLVENTNSLTIGQIVAQYKERELTTRLTPDGTDINGYPADYYTYAGTDYKELNTPEHDLIFKKVVMGENGTVTKSNASYWLASRCVQIYFDALSDAAFYCLRSVYDGIVDIGRVSSSFNASGGTYFPIRPVITLNPNVLFVEKSADGVWSIS